MLFISILFLLGLFYSSTSLASPIVAAYDSATGLPAGYTMKKLGFNITMTGTNHFFEGNSREDIYAQVVAKFPDFKIPYQDEAVIAKGYADMVAGHAASGHVNSPLPQAYNASEHTGLSPRDFHQGPGYHYFTDPYQNWTPANAWSAYNSLHRYDGHPGYFSVPAGPGSCSVWSCDGGGGWTICNDDYERLWMYDNNWYARFGDFLLTGDGACYRAPWAFVCGGQIFHENANLNMVVREGFGC